MKKKFKIISYILLIIPLTLSGLFILIFGGFNLLKYGIYSEYYSLRTEICQNPGIGDNYVPQGIAHATWEDKDYIFTSGYMSNHSASRIYYTDFSSNHFTELTKDEKEFTGHVGGMAISGEKVFLADDNCLYLISLKDIFTKDKVDIGAGVKINNQASFVFATDKYIYVGEFHNGKEYKTNHFYETDEGLHSAIITCYAIEDLLHPLKIFSIRDKVQGFAITSDGKYVLSTSYGLADSIYYVYDESCLKESSYTLDGAPVYYLEYAIREVKGPSMSEDLDIYDGKVISLTESASNKYIFGKFFFGSSIVGLSF